MQRPHGIRQGQMTINVPGVIRTLGESLYADPHVAIRELLQNAHDTCLVRQADDPNAPLPEIHVRYDPFGRSLTIEDNGVGMNETEVEQFLSVIGASNTDAVRSRLEAIGERSLAERLIGRFGLGMLAAFIIGERIEFVTRSFRSEGEAAVWWECSGEQSYRMGQTTRPNAGTTVTVAIKPSQVHLLREDELSRLIRLFADLLSVPIYLDPSPRPVNVMQAPWHSGASESEYIRYLNELYPSESVLAVIPLNVEEDDGAFKLGGVLFIPKQPYLNVREHGDLIIYVRRMFVCRGERSLLPEWAKFVKGVVESPNLRETTSREALRRDEYFERVQRTLGQVILNYLEQLALNDQRLFREIVTQHNRVIKSWALISDELFARIKDIVLFETDAGRMNLPRYFEQSQLSRSGINNDDAHQRLLFYFTTPGGIGQHAVLFAAKGLRVIDAQYFPDEPFLRRYAELTPNIGLRRLDVGGDFIFEAMPNKDQRWLELEERYAEMGVQAQVSQYLPESIPAVLIFSENSETSEQVDTLLADPNLSPSIKQLLQAMLDERKAQRKHTGSKGMLYLNARNAVINQVAQLNHYADPQMRDVLIFLYNNALMLSAQGAQRIVKPEHAKQIFDANNRVASALMNAITGTTNAVDLPPTTVAPYAVLINTLGNNQVNQELRYVLESAPFFLRIVGIDAAISLTEHSLQSLQQAACIVIDASEPAQASLLALGAVWAIAPHVPIIALRSAETEPLAIPAIDAVYDLGVRDEALRRALQELNMAQSERRLTAADFLRYEFVSERLAQALAEQFRSIDQLLRADPAEVSNLLGVRLAPLGLIEELQRALEEDRGH
ncbi:ATP-binding protein [Herpetosiphon gulosus]|uniref:Chaperone protein HtpG n=1 Tax=Herpetosiphon gulosus TaxID=1973496 RepID=A0ABP9X5C9_9CHLR